MKRHYMAGNTSETEADRLVQTDTFYRETNNFMFRFIAEFKGKAPMIMNSNFIKELHSFMKFVEFFLVRQLLKSHNLWRESGDVVVTGSVVGWFTSQWTTVNQGVWPRTPLNVVWVIRSQMCGQCVLRVWSDHTERRSEPPECDLQWLQLSGVSGNPWQTWRTRQRRTSRTEGESSHECIAVSDEIRWAARISEEFSTFLKTVCYSQKSHLASNISIFFFPPQGLPGKDGPQGRPGPTGTMVGED